MGRKKNLSPSFFSSFPLTEGPGLGCRTPGVYTEPTQTEPRRRGASCGTLSTEQSQNPVSPPYTVHALHPGNKLLISVLGISSRQNIGSHQIPSTAQKKLADCVTSFPTTSHFSVLLYISTPKTTEIFFFPAPDF